MVKNLKYIYLIIIGMIINMCLGAVYSWSIFKKPIEELLKVHSTISGLPYMFFLVFYAFAMPFAGKLIAKYGPKKVTLIGGILTSFGWILSGFSNNIFTLILTYGIIAGLGVGIVYGGPLTISTEWFPKQKGLAVGLTLSGFGLSPFVTAPLSIFLIEKYGVMNAFKIIGILFLILISTLSLFLKMPEKKLEDDIDIKTNMKEENFTIEEVVKDKRFRILWLSFMFGTFVGLMAIGISSPVGQEIINISQHQSAFYVALFAIFNGVGRPLFGTLTDKFKFKRVAILNFTLIMIASLIILQADYGRNLVYATAFSIFWLILGGWLAIAPATIASIFGIKNYSRNYGVLFTAYGIGAIVSNMVSGVLKDLTGSYIYVFYITFVVALIGATLLFVAYKEKI